MAEICNKSELLRDSIEGEFLEQLAAAFQTQFELWKNCAGRWSCVCGAASEMDASFLANISFAKSVVEPYGENRFRVVVPLLLPDRGKLVAVGQVEAVSSQFLLPLAEAARIQVSQARQIESLSTQTDNFAAQLTRDVEKMVFIRQLSECTALSMGSELETVVKNLIPHMVPALDCEWIAFITAKDKSPTTDCICDSDCEVIEAGRRSLADERLFALVGECAHHAMTDPYVYQSSDPQHAIRNMLLVRLQRNGRHWGWLAAFNRISKTYGQLGGEDAFSTYDRSLLLQSAAGVLVSQAENLQLLSEREDLLIDVVKTLVSTIEAKDPYTRGHSDRVANYARLLGKQLGLSDDDCERLYLTGLLHDIGKIGVPDATLHKKGELTAEEFAQVKRHPDLGWEILQGVEPLRHIRSGVLFHHERMDGNGYPDGLEGDDIPMDGRILAVADAYDALTCDRSYRSGMHQEEAERMMLEGAGIQWDATVIDALFAVMPEIVKVRQGYEHRPLAVRRTQRG